MRANSYRALRLSALWFSIWGGTAASAQSIADAVGTLEVTHSRQQSMGVLEGCSLIYRVLYQDFATRRGGLVAASGNISVFLFPDSNLVLALKAGMLAQGDDLDKGEAPRFAYVQTKHATTAGAKSSSRDSDSPGFRLWLTGFDANMAKLVEDILEGKEVTLGLVRDGSQLDVLVPLDLSVSRTTIGADGRVERLRSGAALTAFRECLSDLIRK